ncbi:MAG: ABC transporter permease [Tropicimonas sp.]|uniref:ABC transporter permease n=1 Tax=Tropicimonas sp. TaxID=2067044 RepID=UPI003A86C0C3
MSGQHMFDPEQEAEDQRISTVSTESQGYPALVWRRFRKSVPGMIGLVLVGTLLFVSVFASFFAPMDPKKPYSAFIRPDRISFHDTHRGWRPWPVLYRITETDEFDPITYQPITGPDMENPVPIRLFGKSWNYRLFGLIPTSRHFIAAGDGGEIHILGTDKLGRDIFSRAITGSRISLAIALISISFITTIGTLVGIASGYIGGRFDLWMQRVVEVILAFPQLPLYLALATLIPVTAPSWLFLTFVVLVIAGLGWAQLSREVRSKTMSMRRIDYVRAAMAVGAGDGRIILRHVLPNVLSHVIVSVTLGIPSIVLLESFLGFLGFAVKPPMISWGLMLQDAGTFSVIGSYPWILSPVAFVLLTVFAFNALGDGLRDAVDPY